MAILLEAGHRADEKYANVEAAQFFERALEASAKRAAKCRRRSSRAVWEALGDVRMRLGDYTRAGAAYRSSRNSLPGEPVEQPASSRRKRSCRFASDATRRRCAG